MQSANKSPPSALIALENVTKVYGFGENAVNALKGASLAIAPGEFVAFMGPSGSGKSTVMNIICCVDAPTSGTCRFNGVDTGALPRDVRAMLRRHFLGFVCQNPNLLPGASAVENVELPLIYRGLPLAERRRLARAALDRVGLSGREDHGAALLSGDMQQRVAVARAIVTNPGVLLADEPTGNLDTKTSHEIMTLMASLNHDQGMTIVMVTQEAGMAAYARRIVRFLDGRVSSDAPVAHAA